MAVKTHQKHFGLTTDINTKQVWCLSHHHQALSVYCVLTVCFLFVSFSRLFVPTSDLVMRHSGMVIQKNKAIVGVRWCLLCEIGSAAPCLTFVRCLARRSTHSCTSPGTLSLLAPTRGKSSAVQQCVFVCCVASTSTASCNTAALVSYASRCDVFARRHRGFVNTNRLYEKSDMRACSCCRRNHEPFVRWLGGGAKSRRSRQALGSRWLQAR